MSITNQQPLDAFSTLNLTSAPADTVEAYTHFLATADRYRNDAEFRRSLDEGGGKATLDAFGFAAPGLADMDVRIVANTDEVQHFILPPDPNMSLTDEELGSVAGGTPASTVSSAACSTVPSTASTIGCISNPPDISGG